MKKSRGERIETIGLHAVIIFVAAVLIAPLAVMVITSLSYPEDTQMGWGWSFPPTLESHIELWEDSPMATFTFNSVVIALATVVLSLFVATLTAHALARRRFPGRSLLFGSILAIFLVPSLFFSIPLFLIFRIYGLLNTYIGIILAHTAFTVPFLIWILKGYMETVPMEIEEAAIVDGANRLQVIAYVTIPLALPAIFAVSIFAFLGSYHEFALNFVLANKESLRTIPLGAMRYRGISGNWVSFGQIAAYAVESTVPPVLFLFVTSRYMLQGLAAGFGK